MTDGMKDVTAVVLAGGRGTRIRALHPNTPKPLIPVAGQPFLHWLTLWLAESGVAEVLFSTGWLGEQIEDWCRSQGDSVISFSCVREEEPLGTGGALFHCLDACKEWLLVVNGDALCMGGLPELLALRNSDGLDGGLIGVRVSDTSRFGSLVVKNGLLQAFHEKIPGSGLINGGVYLFRKRALASMSLKGAFSIERELIPGLLQKGARLRVVEPRTCPFIDIGTPESLAEAENFVTANFQRS